MNQEVKKEKNNEFPNGLSNLADPLTNYSPQQAFAVQSS